VRYSQAFPDMLYVQEVRRSTGLPGKLNGEVPVTKGTEVACPVRDGLNRLEIRIVEDRIFCLSSKAGNHRDSLETGRASCGQHASR
jgi:hypothetical protein